MSQTDINSSAKLELESIINELFLIKLDSKLNEKVVCFDKKTDDNRKKITRNINDFKEEFQNKSKDLPNFIKKLSSEIKIQSDEVKHFTKDEADSILNRLSEIQSENLDILSEISKKFKKQKNDIEELNHFIKSQTKKIVLDHSNNQEMLKKLHLELSSEIPALVKKNRLKQQEEFLDLEQSISEYIVAKNRNDLDFRNHLENNYQKIEKLNSTLTIDFDEKLKLIRIENENQISKVLSKINIGFISLLFLNIFILILFFYFHLR